MAMRRRRRNQGRGDEHRPRRTAPRRHRGDRRRRHAPRQRLNANATCADWKRSADSSRGSAGRCGRGRRSARIWRVRRVLFEMAVIESAAVSRWNARTPLASRRAQPRQRGPCARRHLASHLLRRRAATVPRTVPASVAATVSAATCARPAPVASGPADAFEAEVEIFSWPSRKRFSGLRSRWTRPLSCAAANIATTRRADGFSSGQHAGLQAVAKRSPSRRLGDPRRYAVLHADIVDGEDVRMRRGHWAWASRSARIARPVPCRPPASCGLGP